MAIITSSIGTSSRTYSTVQLWEDALPASAVTAGNSYVGECYNDSEFTNSAPVLTIAGTTTDSTHTITLKCASGQSFYDNANKLTNQLKYNVSNGVGLRSTGGGGHAVVINNSYVTIDGIQVKDGIGGGAIQQTGGTSTVTVKNCIADSSQSSSGSAATLMLSGGIGINCLAINTGSGSGVVSNGNNSEFHSVTSVQTGAASNFGFRGNYDSPLYKDCASFGYGTAFRSGTSGSSNYNASDDTTAPGANSIKSKTYANQFVDKTNTSAMDFRVKAGADLINAGTRDATYTADLDIVNSARSTSTPTIGAWEYAAAGGGVTGTFSNTLAGVVAAMAGLVANIGSFATALGGVTLAASGSVGLTPSGTFNATLDSVTLAAAGTITDVGSYSATLAGVTLVASGNVATNPTGAFASTLGGVTMSAFGFVGTPPVSTGSGQRRHKRPRLIAR